MFLRFQFGNMLHLTVNEKTISLKGLPFNTANVRLRGNCNCMNWILPSFGFLHSVQEGHLTPDDVPDKLSPNVGA